MTIKLENPIQSTPPEKWLLIAGSLSTHDLRQLVQTSTKLHQLLMSNKEVWMAAFRREEIYREFFVELPLTTILHGQKYRLTEKHWLRIRIGGGSWFR